MDDSKKPSAFKRRWKAAKRGMHNLSRISSDSDQSVLYDEENFSEMNKVTGMLANMQAEYVENRSEDDEYDNDNVNHLFNHDVNNTRITSTRKRLRRVGYINDDDVASDMEGPSGSKQYCLEFDPANDKCAEPASPEQNTHVPVGSFSGDVENGIAIQAGERLLRQTTLDEAFKHSVLSKLNSLTHDVNEVKILIQELLMTTNASHCCDERKRHATQGGIIS
ncbi:hypothetical protein Pmani_015533 [Petrolisthes manimaculis]|uniref:Uncharacterized protein n=1 Tax=Petrolisthes manimaculis TaxID=1843537 RepID=A0AAE1PTQ9_9EUCA|nr:hypothetical protein Pmani_015533 [Petrolisthes manimaculis]